MVYVVGYDGSPAAEAALHRALERSGETAERTAAVTVLPTDAAYAREQGWLGPEEDLDLEAIAEKLQRTLDGVADLAAQQVEAIDVPEGADAGEAVGTVLADIAGELEASAVYLGEADGSVSAALQEAAGPERDRPFDLVVGPD